MLEWVCVSRLRGGELSHRLYSREQQELARAQTSGCNLPLSHLRSLPIGILMPCVNEAASCSEETNTLASPQLLSVCSISSSPGMMSPSDLGVFVCAKRAAAADGAGGGSAVADSPVAAGWLGKGCGTRGVRALRLLHRAVQHGKQSRTWSAPRRD